MTVVEYFDSLDVSKRTYGHWLEKSIFFGDPKGPHPGTRAPVPHICSGAQDIKVPYRNRVYALPHGYTLGANHHSRFLP